MLTNKNNNHRRGEARDNSRNSQLEQALAQRGWVAARGLMFNDRQRSTWVHRLKLQQVA